MQQSITKKSLLSKNTEYTIIRFGVTFVSEYDNKVHILLGWKTNYNKHYGDIGPEEGGIKSSKETPQQGLLREVKEETGLLFYDRIIDKYFDNETQLFIHKNKRKDKNEFLAELLIEIPYDKNINNKFLNEKHDDEFDHLQWIPLEFVDDQYKIPDNISLDSPYNLFSLRY